MDRLFVPEVSAIGARNYGGAENLRSLARAQPLIPTLRETI